MSNAGHNEPPSVDALVRYMEALTEFTDADEHIRKMLLFGSPQEVGQAGDRWRTAHFARKAAWDALTPDEQSKLPSIATFRAPSP